MANHRLYDDFVNRLGEAVAAADVSFVNSLLNEAEDFTKDKIGRDTIPNRLDSAVVLLAVIAYNKRGAEGESSRSEGGISRAFDDLPVTLRERFNNYPRKVGTVYARDDNTDNDG
jgi:hypothetical protein